LMRLPMSALAAVAALVICPHAHADGDPVNDASSYLATCSLVAQSMHDNPANDASALEGIALGIAKQYQGVITYDQVEIDAQYIHGVV
jgi:hypothetical protein